MNTTALAFSTEESVIKYVCGIDIGSQSCSGCVTRPNKQMVIKAITFANSKAGWSVLLERLRQLEGNPNQIVIGMEATSCYHEKLYHELEQRGYQLCLLHPGQTHHFHQQQGLRAKTDRLDAQTIARALRKSAKSARGIFEAEQIATYRELVRLHTQLTEEIARYQNQIHALVVVLIPFVHSGIYRSLLSRSPGGAEPRIQVLRQWRRLEWKRYTRCCEPSPLPTDGSPYR